MLTCKLEMNTVSKEKVKGSDLCRLKKPGQVSLEREALGLEPEEGVPLIRMAWGPRPELSPAELRGDQSKHLQCGCVCTCTCVQQWLKNTDFGIGHIPGQVSAWPILGCVTTKLLNLFEFTFSHLQHGHNSCTNLIGCVHKSHTQGKNY